MCEPGPTSSEVEFNYGETTAEATQVVGAARPGARRQRCFAECAAQPVLPEEVAEWVQFVKGKGVTAVVSMLEAACRWIRSYARPHGWRLTACDDAATLKVHQPRHQALDPRAVQST